MKFKYTLLILLLCLSAVVQAAPPSLPPLPPLVEPASMDKFPGKFIWTDLFSSEFKKSRIFYTELFGWEWRLLSKQPNRYGIFYNAGEAVTGLVEWAPEGGPRPYGRWIHYISVDDVPATIEAVVAQGGRTMGASRNVSERGQYAVLAGLEEAPFGILDSSSGDPDEYRARVGDWIWIDLFTDKLETTINFYKSIFSYSTHNNPDETSPNDVVIASGGYSRGGITALSKDSEYSPQWFGYIRVENISKITSRVAKLGGVVLYAPEFDVHDMAMAIIEAPDGSIIGLMEWNYDVVDPELEAAP